MLQLQKKIDKTLPSKHRFAFVQVSDVDAITVHMKFTINKKMDKSVAFRGRVVKILIPRAGRTYFNVCNAVLDKMLKGRKLKDYFTAQTGIARKDGSIIRVCVYSRRNVLDEKIVETEEKNANKSPLSVEDINGGIVNFDKNGVIFPTGKVENSKRPIIMWIHGGGYAMGSPEQEFYFVKRILKAVDAIVVSPEYTRSTEASYPHAIEDCYAALVWVKENAEKFGADVNRIFVGGDSAGGGLCAAVCLYARDKKEVNVAFQMPLYPMLDDRPTRTNQDNSTPCWDTQSNNKAWKFYLGDLYGTDKVPYYAAPARATDLSGLPPAVSYVGDIEPFYAETVDYMEKMKAAGVPVEYRVYKGCYHGFDVICPESEPGKDAIQFLHDSLVYAAENYTAKQPE